MIDMTNQKFNKLTVIKFDHYDKKYNSYFLTFRECTKSLTWWTKKLQIKPEKLKKLLEKESFEKICIDYLTLDKELNIL